jgi:hypothetical protein
MGAHKAFVFYVLFRWFDAGAGYRIFDEVPTLGYATPLSSKSRGGNSAEGSSSAEMTAAALQQQQQPQQQQQKVSLYDALTLQQQQLEQHWSGSGAGESSQSDEDEDDGSGVSEGGEEGSERLKSQKDSLELAEVDVDDEMDECEVDDGEDFDEDELDEEEEEEEEEGGLAAQMLVDSPSLYHGLFGG